jgi:uncharacterized membrane protein YqjE
MGESTVSFTHLATASKQLAERLLTCGENRIQLLAVEVQEERERLLLAFLLAIGAAVFGFFAGLALTAAIVVLVWPYSHVAVLLALTGLYGAAGICLYWRLVELLRDWQTLSASLDQLRKDRECLATILG